MYVTDEKELTMLYPKSDVFFSTDMYLKNTKIHKSLRLVLIYSDFMAHLDLKRRLLKNTLK